VADQHLDHLQLSGNGGAPQRRDRVHRPGVNEIISIFSAIFNSFVFMTFLLETHWVPRKTVFFCLNR
jgi:hypothetical protein